MSANLVTLLLFYELFSLLAWPLIVHERTPEAFRAGVKYLVYILSGGGMVFAGVALVYWLADSAQFMPGGLLSHSMLDELPRGGLIAACCLLLAGFGVKAALMPLHGWVPDAHPAAPARESHLPHGQAGDLWPRRFKVRTGAGGHARRLLSSGAGAAGCGVH